MGNQCFPGNRNREGSTVDGVNAISLTVQYMQPKNLGFRQGIEGQESGLSPLQLQLFDKSLLEFGGFLPLVPDIICLLLGLARADLQPPYLQCMHLYRRLCVTPHC